MFVFIAVIAVTVLVGLAVALGLTHDSRQPGREWYPAGPDLRD